MQRTLIDALERVIVVLILNLPSKSASAWYVTLCITCGANTADRITHKINDTRTHRRIRRDLTVLRCCSLLCATTDDQTYTRHTVHSFAQHLHNVAMLAFLPRIGVEDPWLVCTTYYCTVHMTYYATYIHTHTSHTDTERERGRWARQRMNRSHSRSMMSA